MNKIVREHYPASKLPKELREGNEEGAAVTVQVEHRKPLSREEVLDFMSKVEARGYKTSLEEAVSRVRELRDEWD